jgi:hypothetical protein
MKARVISKSLDGNFDEELGVAVVTFSYSIPVADTDGDDGEEFFESSIHMPAEDADKFPLGEEVDLL